MNKLEEYQKTLVARFSPKNDCNVSDGQELIVIPRAKVPVKTVVQHNFLSGADHKTVSKYGWVEARAPFTLDEFVERHFEKALADDGLEHLRVMLKSIQKLQDGTPVAATYRARGLGDKKMVFTVHKVVFYQA